MTKDTQLTKYQIWGVHLLGGFFDALHRGQLPEFLQSDEIERLLQQVASGSFGSNIPDGTPGSEFPTTGGKDPLDVLHGLFQGVASGLGRVDHSGQADPASEYGDREYNRRDIQNVTTTEQRTAFGSSVNRDEITIYLKDGSTDTFTEDYDENGNSTRFERSHMDHGSTSLTFERIEPESHDGSRVTTGTFDEHGEQHVNRVFHLDRGGRLLRSESPGEDGGGDTNTDRNPLDNIEVVGPQSPQQMISAMQHPGKDSEEFDPNTGGSGFKLSEADQERLGRIAPGAEVLDPNSGVDPLSALNLDPNQIHTRSEDDDRVDPNTGLKPVPTGG